VAKGGEFWAQKQCGSKPLSMAPKSCVHSMLNPIVACGLPIVFKPHLDP
jgi:hypothetical protein